jgi:predicted SAM-dependent methyltransferase
MKLYVGARDYRPEGYLTVDIDPRQNPDIVANITDMSNIESCSCSEIVASHVLEHLEWPDSFGAIAEFSRVLEPGGKLKIAIPDADLLISMIKEGDNPFFAAGLLFGVGGRDNKFEQHRFTFNATMMNQILGVLGFSVRNWWNSPMPDASNGWCYTASGSRVAISLNLESEKTSDPVVAPRQLYEALLANPLSDFYENVAKLMSTEPPREIPAAMVDARLYQLIHFKLIEAQQRIKHLESKLWAGKR